MILYLKHVDIEGPETLGDFFDHKGFESTILNIHEGDRLPDRLDGLEAVIGLGGPMNVDEEDLYAWLAPENTFIQRIVDQEIPYLGLCLGSQLLAKACGAAVVKSPAEEIGFSNIQLTPVGKADPLFRGLNAHLNVFQWHGDMFDVPQNGQLLAASDKCPHQAFRFGKNAYGLQFHVEITAKSIKEWADRYITDVELCSRRKQQMLDDYEATQSVFEKEAQMIYNNFLQIIHQNEKSKKAV